MDNRESASAALVQREINNEWLANCVYIAGPQIKVNQNQTNKATLLLWTLQKKTIFP